MRGEAHSRGRCKGTFFGCSAKELYVHKLTEAGLTLGLSLLLVKSGFLLFQALHLAVQAGDLTLLLPRQPLCLLAGRLQVAVLLTKTLAVCLKLANQALLCLLYAEVLLQLLLQRFNLSAKMISGSCLALLRRFDPALCVLQVLLESGLVLEQALHFKLDLLYLLLRQGQLLADSAVLQVQLLLTLIQLLLHAEEALGALRDRPLHLLQLVLVRSLRLRGPLLQLVVPALQLQVCCLELLENAVQVDILLLLVVECVAEVLQFGLHLLRASTAAPTPASSLFECDVLLLDVLDNLDELIILLYLLEEALLQLPHQVTSFVPVL
mmetsp:Transcript_1976/g.7140  ORF Transcript_1976/g.7140 Transcript_1976/m.7140 type:complete len:323 (+) Transcript_1976:1190-2158(+)